MLKFTIIACLNNKGVLGKDGDLLYHIPNDLSNFARATKYNGVVIMGRKTFGSLPNGEPLKGRINIIITNNQDYGIDVKFDNVYIVHSVADAIELCEAFFSEKELFVIGGASIYNAFMESQMVDEMRLTVVDDDSEGDVFFPNFDEKDWYLYYKSLPQTCEDGNLKYAFCYKILKKIVTNE